MTEVTENGTEGSVENGTDHEWSIENGTEGSLLRFEADRIFNNVWSDKQDSGDKAMQVLESQLKFAGGFFTRMELIDFNAPSNVTLNLEGVLTFLENKSPNIASVEKLIIPNVGTLESSDQVRAKAEKFCSVLGSPNKPVEISFLVLPCNEVSPEFRNGNLEWIDQFCTRHSVKRISVNCKVPSVTDSFLKFKEKFCGSDRLENYKKSDFCKDSNKKRSAPQPTDGSKRSRKSSLHEEFNDVMCENNSKDRLPSTSILKKCWHIDQLHKRITGKGVTIAFLDSGINIDHEAFIGKIKAVNDIRSDGTIDLTTDSFGHGTMCAFVACGKSFKATGLEKCLTVPAGVAPGAKIVMYKIIDDSGRAHTDTITKALQQCVEDKERYNIDIVLLPYGSDYHDLDQGNAILDLIRKGVLVVTASGNQGCKNDVSYPARLGHTICIGSHDMHYHTIQYTSKGRALDYTAPGEYLAGACSKHPTAFTIERGTSYAAASVAGLLALIIEYVSDEKTVGTNKKKPPLQELVHNQDVMKRVLRNISRYHTRHDEEYGYGHLTPSEIFSKKKKELRDFFYKDIFDHESKSSTHN